MRTTTYRFDGLFRCFVLLLIGISAQAAAMADDASFNPLTLAFHFSRQHVPDIDQRRDTNGGGTIHGLPNAGAMYCAPTSTMDWLAYIANHGYPNMQPGIGNWQALNPPLHTASYNHMTDAIFDLGVLMGTDPVKGSGADGDQIGAQLWLDAYAPGEFVVMLDAADGGYAPTFSEMALLSVFGSLVNASLGSYSNAGEIGLPHIRGGGHQVTVVYARYHGIQSDLPMRMGIRDPWADSPGDTLSQSHYHTERYDVVEEPGLYGYQKDNGDIVVSFRTQARIVGYGSKYLDNFKVISPRCGLSASDSSLKVLKPGHMTREDGPEVQNFKSAGAGRILDIAMMPNRVRHPYIVDGSNTIWMFNAVSGDSERLVDVDRPRRLVLGGRTQNLFVLSPDKLTRFDRYGNLANQASLKAPLDAIGYNDATDRLVGVSRSDGALYAFDSGDLRVIGRFPLPDVLLGREGRLTLHYCAGDGSFYLYRAGADRVFRIHFGERGSEIAPIQVPVDSASGFFVDERGTLYLSDRGRIRVFSGDGKPNRRSKFDGLPGGEILQILRPFSNFNPETMTGPSFYNVPPNSPGK